MTYETLIYEKEDGIGIVTLNRPERLNAINLQLIYDLIVCVNVLLALDFDSNELCQAIDFHGEVPDKGLDQSDHKARVNR